MIDRISSFRVALSMATALLVGCNSAPRVPVSDLAAAQDLLEESLNAWKEGKSVEDLRNQTPPVYVAEDGWLRGNALTEFSIDGAGEMYGSNARFTVTLKNNTRGSSQVRYLVTTVPALTIAKEDQ
jgi:hypothetical protein